MAADDGTLLKHPRDRLPALLLLQPHRRELLLSLLLFELAPRLGLLRLLRGPDRRHAVSLRLLRGFALLRRERVRAPSGFLRLLSVTTREDSLLVVAVDLALVRRRVVEGSVVHGVRALRRGDSLRLGALLGRLLRRLLGEFFEHLSLSLGAFLLGQGADAVAHLLLVLAVASVVVVVVRGLRGVRGLGGRLRGLGGLGLGLGLIVGGFRLGLLPLLPLAALAALAAITAAALLDAVLANVNQELLHQVGALPHHLLHLRVVERVAVQLDGAHLLLLELPHGHREVADLVVVEEDLGEKLALAEVRGNGLDAVLLGAEGHQPLFFLQVERLQRV